MRLVVVMAVVYLAGCASEKLAQAPPAGVDFSGSWKLNIADSDDPQRLIQAQFNAPAAGQSAPPSGGGPGGRNGRQGGGRGGAGYPGGPGGPVMPPVAVLSEGLRWPGKQLEIKQVAGVVAFTSDGINRVCQPTDTGRTHRHHASTEYRDGASSGRDAPPRARDAPAPRCGWTEKTLIVQGGDPDDDHPPFEEHYSVSDDGQRLVEVVDFKGGRSSGFTMSRVWDRAR
jgi:hypothetical protein